MLSDSTHRVVALGEAMMQITPSPLGSLATSTHASLSVAGAESTVASYLATLGHHALWLSAVGDDPIGERIVSEIRSAGVDTESVTRHPSAPSGTYFKDPQPGGSTDVYYYRSGSAASRMSAESIEQFEFLRTDIVHLSGITPALSASCRELVDAAIDAAHSAGAMVSFDVNYRRGLWARHDAAPILGGVGKPRRRCIRWTG